MMTTIDAAGRVVIQKSLRDLAGITGAAKVEITVRNGRIEIEMPATPMKLERVNGLPVITAAGLPELLPAARANAVLQSIRSEREKATPGGIGLG